MEKTLKQIADELGVSKQQVYRFVKTHHIKEARQEKGKLYYDDAAEYLIKQGFEQKLSASENAREHISDALIETLRIELLEKNKQIAELNARLSEVTAALTASMIQQQQLLLEKPKKHWWQRNKT